jgi:hypothetical protein
MKNPSRVGLGALEARRTFITLSEQKGVSHSQIMKVTGIRSIKTLENYIKVDKESLSKAIIDAWS